MNDLLQQLVNLSPLLVALLAGGGAAWFLFWQTDRLETKLSEQVADKVASEMSNRLAALQGLIETATQREGELEHFLSRAKLEAEKFQQEIDNLSSEAQEESKRLRELLGELKVEIPDIGWTSPRELVIRAREAVTWRDASKLLEPVLKDQNATAQDLELAGDRARELRAFAKALEFYRMAASSDPERTSARVELLALTAEFDFKQREEALLELEEVIQKRPLNRTYFSRFFNTLMVLGRHEQMANFCKSFMKTPNLPSELVAQMYRNLAVSHWRLDQIADARAAFEHAYHALPQDENVVKAYAEFLQQIGERERYRELIHDLVRLDPADPDYAHSMARSLEQQNRDEEALKWIARARELGPDATTDFSLSRLAARIQAKLSLPVVVGDSLPSHSGGKTSGISAS